MMLDPQGQAVDHAYTVSSMLRTAIMSLQGENLEGRFTEVERRHSVAAVLEVASQMMEIVISGAETMEQQCRAGGDA